MNAPSDNVPLWSYMKGSIVRLIDGVKSLLYLLHAYSLEALAIGTASDDALYVTTGLVGVTVGNGFVTLQNEAKPACFSVYPCDALRL